MADNLFNIPKEPPKKHEIKNFTKYFQMQEQTQWCWIATSVAVANYYATEKAPLKVEHSRQCQVYAEVVPKCENACMLNAQYPLKLSKSDECNQPGFPEEPMRHLQIYSEQRLFYTMDPTLSSHIIEALANDEPLIVGYNKTSGHAATFYGYDTDKGTFLIADPWHGLLEKNLNQLQLYGANSSWLFFSKSPY